MAKTAVAVPDAVDIAAIDRLEQKLKQLVAVLNQTRGDYARASEELTRTRAEQARAAEENTRLRAELDAVRGRLADAEQTGGELAALRSHREAAYIATLAAYVEQKMLLAAKESPAGDTLKIAVLAALNIADECFRARQDGTSQRTGLAERALELERMLDL